MRITKHFEQMRIIEGWKEKIRRGAWKPKNVRLSTEWRNPHEYEFDVNRNIIIGFYLYFHFIEYFIQANTSFLAFKRLLKENNQN